MMAADILSARQTSRAARGCRALTAATIRMPAVTASGTCCTSGAAASMTSTTNAAVTTDDQRVRAPAPTLSAVACTDPPATPPVNTPEKMLATPWPTKSLLVSPKEPSALGTERLIPAAWTSPMMTSETAGSASWGMSEKSGNRGHGSARGIGAMSPTTATDVRSNTATTTVITSRASAIANSLRRVRLSTTTSSTVVRPMTVVATSDAAGCMNRSAATRTLLSWRLENPVRAPSWESRICTPMPPIRPIITALETKRTSAPARRRPRTSMRTPVSTARVNRPVTRCSGGRSPRRRPPRDTAPPSAPWACAGTLR